jgi:hypothetical protein
MEISANARATPKGDSIPVCYSMKLARIFEVVGCRLSIIITPLNKFFVIISALMTFIMAGLIAVDVFLRFFSEILF